MGQMEGKVAIITGAAGGLGRSAALKFAAEGAAVAITDIQAEALKQTAEMVQAKGVSVTASAGDITDAAFIDAFASEIIAQHSRIDALCNVAGVLGGGPIEDHTVEEFDRLMHINCLAHLLTIQRVLPEMKRARNGSIVNVASVGGLVALPHMSVYCASKAAVIGLTKAVAYEVGPDIRCNAVCPGGIDTPMARNFLEKYDDQQEMIGKLVGRQIIKRFAQPEEIAAALLFLCSETSSFITGAVIPVEAGHTTW